MSLEWPKLNLKFGSLLVPLQYFYFELHPVYIPKGILHLSFIVELCHGVGSERGVHNEKSSIENYPL